MQVQFVGCGDAFGSGGRFNTCFLVEGIQNKFLIDCGASSLIALRRQAIDLNSIQAILISHFHADHFGGLPFFMLDAQFFSKRSAPLTIAGPAGVEKCYRNLCEAMFPGSTGNPQHFDLTFLELPGGSKRSLAGMEIEAFEVNHGRVGGPFLGYRISIDRKTLAYTGDTEWTEALVDLGRDADLLIAEAYFYEKKVRLHLDYKTLEQNLNRLNPRRLVLTHMSPEMIAREAAIPFQLAHDGLSIAI